MTIDAPLTVNDRLRMRYADLTPSQRMVADALLANPENGAMSNVQRLASMAGVSAATVVRFAVALGYSGFTELQDELRATMVEALRPTNRLIEPAAHGSTFVMSLERDRESLGELAQSLQTADLAKAVNSLQAAPRVFVRGGRTSSTVALFVASMLAQMRPNVASLDNPDGLSEVVGDIGPGDVLLAIHLPRYTKTTQRIGEYFHAQGASLVLVADSVKSPLAPLSEVLLMVPYQSISFFNSNVAAMAIANALLAGFANVQQRVTKERLDALEAVFEHFDTHVLSSRRRERHRAESD